MLICCTLWLSPNVVLRIMAKHFHPGLVCPRASEALWFVQVQFCNFYDHCMIWPWGEFSEVSALGKIGSWLERCPHVNNVFHFRMMDFKLFGNGLITLPRLMGTNNCFSKIIAEVELNLWSVLTHTIVLQTRKTHTQKYTKPKLLLL